MKWLALKASLKKARAWAKAYWYVPVMVLLALVGLLLWALTKNSAFISAVMDAFEGQRESYKKEIEILNNTHKKEAEEKAKALEVYNENLKALEEEYAKRNETLNSAKKRELKKLIDEGYNDPEKLSRELAKLYGLEHG
jgi:flagellar motility protein MotE (MotC chaperone)|tara:strand:+ start:247 stop:663 length:417 start_codon:yes stop_codon:yes gene_type:complete